MSTYEFVRIAVGVIAVLAVADLLGRVSRRCQLGLVTAEIAAGIVLGPTLFGRLVPDLHNWVFNSGAQAGAWHAISQTGLVLFLFAAGLDLDVTRIRRGALSIALTAVFGTFIPFIAGFLVVVHDTEFWDFPAEYGSLVPALLAGTLFSVSALPVILRVLSELRLQRSTVGETIIGAAIVDDVIGWIVFGAIVHSIAGRFGWTGSDGVFLAFAAGIALANTPLSKHQLLWNVRVFIFRYCAPVYFASIALRVDFATAWDTTLIVVLLAVSSVAKLSGVTLGARMSGVGWREALAIASGMNARGAMGIVLAGTALNAGLLNERLFVAFVAVAVATSLACGPAMRFLLRPGTGRVLTPADAVLGRSETI